MFKIFKTKQYWLYLLLVFIVLGIFSFAQLGARNTTKLHEIPVAVLNQSSGKASKNLADKLTSSNKSNSKIKWIKVSSKHQLNRGFNQKKYYGAMILNKDFSQNLTNQQNRIKNLIVQSKLQVMIGKAKLPAQKKVLTQQANLVKNDSRSTVKPAKIQVQINQGANATIANGLTSVLPAIANNIGMKITSQKQTILNKSGLNLPAGEWSSLNNSIQVRTQTC